MDCLDGAPKHILGFGVKSRTQIVITCLIPAIFELLCYTVLITADIYLTTRHFINNNVLWGALSLGFICLPALACFISVITSKWQWPESEGCHSENIKFFFVQLFNLIFFPIGAINR